MKKSLLFFMLALVLTSSAKAGLSDVSTFVTADRKIAIVYTLTADDPDNTMPVFAVNFSAEIAGKKPFAMKTLEGPGKTGIVIGEGTYTSVWDVAKDCKKEDPNAITVSAEGSDVTDKATYLCLDLKKYKMRYQNDPPDITKSTCKTKELWLRRIEPGTFMMGSPTKELGRSENETQHEVTLTKAYYIGIFETTQIQFKAISGYNFYSSYKGATRPANCSYDMLRGAQKGSQWPGSYEVDETFSYIDRNKTVERPIFFHALRSKTGEGLMFDLPTEAQWEYACRAGTTTAWNNGTDIKELGHDLELDKLGCYLYNGGSIEKKNGNIALKGHAKVGSYQPNAWGLYDMHGNVCEWCLDWYNVGSSDPVTDPVGGSLGTDRVHRGGSWGWSAYGCRSAFRFYYYPGYGGYEHGFRVALVQNMFSQNQKNDFEFDIPSETENTLPVFKVSLYGKTIDGKEYLLEEIGTLEYDGASGIVLGKGPHKLTWLPDPEYADLADELELVVEYEDVTSQATYLVLDLPSNKMRTSKSGPDISDDKCRTEELWLRRIEPGTFTMGSPGQELGRNDNGNEIQHNVTLTKAYYIGVFEVTQKQCELFAGYNLSYYMGETRPAENLSYDTIRGSNKGSQWPQNYEVDENSVLGLMRRRAGNIFDLPTEAQWEFACRAGTTTALNSGKNLTATERCPNMDEVGRYNYNREDGKGGYAQHTTVGSYLPNAWGLYDMHGNVDEWCLDWFQRHLGSNSVTDPCGSSVGSHRAVRGGHWKRSVDYCRSARRLSTKPDASESETGFRVALASGQDIQIKKDFEFDIPSGTENTLPVFKVKLYGKAKGGKEYLLEEIGKLEYDGASGMVLGKGPHRLTWIPDIAYTNLVDEIELRVEYEDVTSQATYLVLDLPSNKMRTSSSEPDLENDKCRTEELWMKRIEPGNFIMGSPKKELERKKDEKQHSVTLTKAFYMGIFEITQKQCEFFADSNPSIYVGETRPVDYVSYNLIRGANKGSQWPQNHEVDDNSILGLMRRRAGNIFDLPTEAQWEYACRAGTTTAWNNGIDIDDPYNDYNLNGLGRYSGNRGYGEGGYFEHTVVGTYQPNAWGLYDMHGNVCEWCLDWYDSKVSTKAVTDPIGPQKSYYRVRRGGGWSFYAHACRSACRRGESPDARKGNDYYYGFRVVLVQ